MDYKGQKKTQYNMFERRFADKLTYFDWRLGFLIDEKDIGILVDSPSPKKPASESEKGSQ